MSNTPMPFQLQVGYDQPELLGARWWQQSLAQAAGPARTAWSAGGGRRDGEDDNAASRRRALGILAALGGTLVFGGIVANALGGGDSSPQILDHDSLELQRQQGLAALSSTKEFVWQQPSERDHAGAGLDRSLLPQLANDLRPADPAWVPIYRPTLFQAFGAPAAEDFVRQFRLVSTTSMQRAFAQGAAVRELIEMLEQPREWALIVDLPGPDSAAFTAGLSPAVTPVFLFGNWPHPRGVVPAHQTLGAVMHYRSRLLPAKDGAVRPAAMVLDRDRLRPYRNEPDRFDNRYAAVLPSAGQLQQLGVEQLLYVVPENAEERELDDLNERFVEYRAAGIEVRMLGLKDLLPAPAGSQPQAVAGRADNRDAYYGGSRFWWGGGPLYHGWFWNQYGAASRPYGGMAERPPRSAFGGAYTPSRRTTTFDGIARLGRTQETRTSGGGSSSRSSGGSWGRSSGSGYGG